MSRRKVAVVTSEVLGLPGTGGPGTADSFLAIALARHGHDVELLVAPGRDVSGLTARWDGLSVRPVAERSRVEPSFLAPAAHVYAALREDPPDVVVADDWRALPFAALRARQAGLALTETAFVLYCHGPARVFAAAARKVPDTLARFGEEVAQRACVELADAVVSPSLWLVEWMREHGWPLGESVHVIQNLWESAARGRPEVPVPRAPIRCLAFFGQLREGKGLRVFLDALRRVGPARLQGVDVLFLGHARSWTQGQLEEALGGTVVAGIRVETGLDRAAALAVLKVPGTLAVMPSLLENSPYAVAECVEHGIPFLAADVGGTPELIDPADRARVLHPPQAEAFARALERALTTGVEPARPARAPEESLAAWLDLIGSVAQRQSSRRGVTDDSWVVFPDDARDERLLERLVAAQAASGADIVTTGVRREDGAVQLFLGDPGPLGLVENHYGEVGLVRREDVVDDPPWVLFARLALGGARIVSVPEAWTPRSRRVETAAERLAVLEAFESAPSEAVQGLAQLTATLAAAAARAPADGRPGLVQRLRRKLLG
jgi:glycosyltransferase involved in cell wall biosynthesis